MRIVIAGGTGQVGTVLCRAFLSSGDDVLLLSRNPNSASHHATQWDGRTLGAWTGELEGADVVIDLAGRSVDCLYGKQNRLEILESRVDWCARLAERCKRQPTTASVASGIHGDHLFPSIRCA